MWIIRRRLVWEDADFFDAGIACFFSDKITIFDSPEEAADALESYLRKNFIGINRIVWSKRYEGETETYKDFQPNLHYTYEVCPLDRETDTWIG